MHSYILNFRKIFLNNKNSRKYLLPLIKLYHQLKGSKKIISRSELNIIVNNYSIITKNSLDFKKSGNAITEIKTNISSEIPSILGWVPLINNRTSIVVYHFLSTNYSIRKQAIIRISIVEESKLIDQKCFLFPPFSCKEFKINELFNNVIANTIFVEIFHPEIKINHGGFDGHLRFWGKYYDSNNNFLSTVHSMPFSQHVSFIKKHKNSRIYFYNNASKLKNMYSSIGTFDFNNNNSQSFYGFNIILDNNDDPKAVWHHCPPPLINTELSKKSEKITQIFWIPPYSKIDPVVVIDSYECGVTTKQEALISIIKNNEVIQSKKILIDNFFCRSLSTIFNESIIGPCIIMVEFFRNSKGGFMHVHYDKKNIPGDQVHTLVSNWQTKNEKLEMIIKSPIGNTRKFGHLHKSQFKSKHYINILTHSLKDNKCPKIKIRIFTDTGKEFIKNIELKDIQPVLFLEIEELFPNIVEQIDDCGIAQIESTDDNFGGSFIYHDLKNDNIAVDHLTGG